MSHKDLLKTLSQDLFSELKTDEKMTMDFHAEESEFVRFNGAKVRQATDVQQIDSYLTLFGGADRSTTYRVQLSGDLDSDRKELKARLDDMRADLKQLPEDPYVVLPKDNGTSDESHAGQHPQGSELMDQLFGATKDLDFVGIYQAGPVSVGNANSEGQFHWFSSNNFAVDYSLFAKNENAVKGTYSGARWSESGFTDQLNKSRKHLEMMQKDSRKIERGEYRTFLAPGAVGEMVDTIAWGGLSFKAYKTGGCPFEQLFEGKKQLSQKIQWKENYSMGLTPRFNESGEVSPLNANLINNGKMENMLVSTKTAKEFGVESNYASEAEYPRAVEIVAGQLSEDDVLKELGTGLYLSNLHYLNWSDRNSARITGMTRYACFWVENGELVSPIEDLRFDVSVYDVWGANLIDLTQSQETISDVMTYDKRHLGGMRVPGMLIDGFKFTL